MKKHIFGLMLSAVAIFAGCSNGEGGEGGMFTPPTQEQLTQNAYADNENTGGGFSFTTDAPWTATVSEAQPASQAFAMTKQATVYSDGNNVAWLRLYNGDKEAYNGEAGTITLRIEIDQNYTGKRREATITIKSGNNSFTVTVVQEATKQDGTPNDAPVQVTAITLDKTALSLKVGDKATLTATVEPADATIKSVTWASSNPDVASVNSLTGEITATGNGAATISATSTSNKEVSASCVVTVSDKSDPTVPTYKKLISKIVKTYVDNDTETIDFSYDENQRLTKMVVQGTKESSSGSVSTSFTVNLTYGNNSVSYEIIGEENGTTSSYKDTGSATLDDAGRVVSGKWSTYDTESTPPTLITCTYEHTLDANGHLVKSVSTNDGENRITWSNGNPTELQWGLQTSYTDKATYGSISNKANLDLNWAYVLAETEGWAFASGDANNIFSLMGLTATRATNMAKTVTTPSVNSSEGYDLCKYTYQTDTDGMVTKITKNKLYFGTSEDRKELEVVITYTE